MTPIPAYLYIICVVLITRLFFQFRDDAITRKHTIYKIIIESAALLAFAWNYWLVAVLAVLLILNMVSLLLENRLKDIKLIRLVFLLLYFIVLGLLISPNTNVRFNPDLLSSILNFESTFVLLTFLIDLDWNHFWFVLTGLLLVLNETNVFIRYLMESLRLAPLRKASRKSEEIDMVEYNRGRVIGILERVLIYYFVLNGHLSAVGFVLAAKGVTRFKELDDREFAEYFLIGTLLSSIISGAVALLVRGLL